MFLELLKVSRARQAAHDRGDVVLIFRFGGADRAKMKILTTSPLDY